MLVLSCFCSLSFFKNKKLRSSERFYYYFSCSTFKKRFLTQVLHRSFQEPLQLSTKLRSWLWTELHPDAFHWGPSLGTVASGCGGGMEEGRKEKGGRGAWARRRQGLPEPGGGQALQVPCPKWALGQPLLGTGMLAWPGWGCLLPILPRHGPLRFPAIFSLSYLSAGRADVRFLWLPAPKHPGLGDLPA